MKESTIQQQICDYLSAKGFFFFSIPNEHWNISHAQRRLFKKMGMLPGMPDLCVITDWGHIFFLEVKTDEGKVSEQQKIIHEVLKRKGIAVFVVRSLEEAIPIIRDTTK
jgi:hypothetical protein